MKTHIFKGSKTEIVESVVALKGKFVEVIVFVEDQPVAGGSVSEDIFAEMQPYMASAEDVDYSRESLYLPLEGE